MSVPSKHPAVRRHLSIEDYANWTVKGALANACRAYVFSDIGEEGDGEVMSVAFYRYDEDKNRWYADAGSHYFIPAARELWADLVKNEGYVRVA